MSWCQSQTLKNWWWRVLTIIVLVIAVNAFISFLHARLHPSHCTRSTAVPFRLQQANLELLTEPKALYLSVDTPLLPLSDKDLVLRSAYVNPRPHAHANSTIILIEIRKSLIEQGAIERCGVGPYSSTQFEVVSIEGRSCSSKTFPHTVGLLYCYDVRANHLDTAWISYTKLISGEKAIFTARAEQPVILNWKTNGAGEVVVCAAMLPHYTPFVEDWLRYQKTVGVDHVHLTLESVFLNQGKFDEEFLQTSVEDFYLSVTFWHRWLNDTDICDHSLDLALYDCVLRFQQTYSNILIADPRDFFVPLESDSPTATLPSFLSRWCPGDAHCQFEQWNMIYKDCKSAGEDGNVTAVVSAKRAGQRSGYLSVYKSALLPYNIKEPGLDPDSADVKEKVKVVPAEKGYFARLLKHETFSSIRILPYDEHC
jgi:hypothetical protein